MLLFHLGAFLASNTRLVSLGEMTSGCAGSPESGVHCGKQLSTNSQQSTKPNFP